MNSHGQLEELVSEFEVLEKFWVADVLIIFERFAIVCDSLYDILSWSNIGEGCLERKFSCSD